MPKRDEIKWIDLPGLSGAYSAAGFRSKQYATYVVAAVDSTPDERAAADYVCDGVADETEINAALSAKGGLTRVLLLSGHFYIQSTINMVAGAVLEGQGSATVLSVSVTFSTSGEVIIGADHIQIKNLVIDGSSRAHINTIRLDTYEDVLVDGVAFQNMNHWRGFSIYGDGSNDIRIVNCRVDGSNASQAFIDQYAATGAEFRRLTVQGCHFANMTGPVTIQVYGDEEPSTGKLPLPGEMTVRLVTVVGNTYEGDATGTFFSGVNASGLTITGNTINNCSDGVGIQDCFDVTVSGNVITTCNIGVRGGNSYYADDRGGSQLYSITGNTIRQAAQCIAVLGPPRSDGDGTRETDDFRVLATIAGNTLVDAGEGNITVGTASRLAITGNTIVQTDEFDGTGTAGIEVVQSWELVISGNQITGNLNGILISESAACLITGNSFIANGPTTNASINISFACDDLKIDGNYFYGEGQYHIHLPNSGGGSTVEIVGNTFDGATYAINNQHSGSTLIVWHNIFRSGSIDFGITTTPPVVRDNRTTGGNFQDALRGGAGSGTIGVGSPGSGDLEVSADDGAVPSWIVISADATEAGVSNFDAVSNAELLTTGNVYIFSPDTGDTITVKATNFKLAGAADFVMNSVYDRIVLHWTGTTFVELSRSNNG